jgi:subtilisin family serine protease
LRKSNIRRREFIIELRLGKVTSTQILKIIKKRMKRLFQSLWIVLIVGVSTQLMNAQPKNWYNLDYEADGVPGLSTERMYEKLIEGRDGRTVIVAVLDSGVDPDHEDLKEVMWVNADEIPNNGIDDDNNGYIDDVHGWNFLGGKDGRNVQYDNLEVTRIYRKLKPKYENKTPESISSKEQAEYDLYVETKEAVETNRKNFADAERIKPFYDGLQTFREEFNGEEEITVATIEAYETDDPTLAQVKQVLLNYMNQGMDFEELASQIEGEYEYYNAAYNYRYNIDFDPRDIIGDDYNDPKDRDYGNKDVEGPDAMHGTAVAGAVAAVRNNDIGVNGVANNVRIMAVRCVPDGDERDKDVANAIRYAVDNGASIINMSFGKGYSWDKKAVDKAIKYAAKKDVLLVHAAGNDGKENELTNNFPNDTYEKKPFFGKQSPNNWLEVGALSWQPDTETVATFSNYSKQYVDIFAPGVDMYLPIPDDKYRNINGTSFSAPVVAGAAAMLRSYFPGLTAEQVKDILMDSSMKPEGKVKQPGTGELVEFKELSVSGGMTNVFNAMLKASKTKGKKRVKAEKDVVIP